MHLSAPQHPHDLRRLPLDDLDAHRRPFLEGSDRGGQETRAHRRERADAKGDNSGVTLVGDDLLRPVDARNHLCDIGGE